MKYIFPSNNEKYPFDLERKFLESVSVADKERAGKYLGLLTASIIDIYKNESDVIQSRLYELAVTISRTAVKNGADPTSCMNISHSFLQSATRYNTVESTCYRLNRLLDKCIDELNMPQLKHMGIIRKATAYMADNYTKKVTLEEVSTFVYLSPAYFSKIFKEKTGVSFNTYINNLRVEKSKILLAENKMKLMDIAIRVGFDSQSYFNKVFKKSVGISPLQFRISHSR